MTLIQLVAIAGILTFAALWANNVLMGIVASAGWVFSFIYVVNNSIGIIVIGSPTHEAILIALGGAVIAVPMSIVFRRGREDKSNRTSGDGEEHKDKGFKLSKFLDSGDTGYRARRQEESPEEYRAKVYKALHPPRRARR
jgi:hypothetical protein